jgi:hypothetical protein
MVRVEHRRTDQGSEAGVDADNSRFGCFLSRVDLGEHEAGVGDDIATRFEPESGVDVAERVPYSLSHPIEIERRFVRVVGNAVATPDIDELQ